MRSQSDQRVQRCTYCEQQHKPRYLCDPAKRMLDALKARGASFSMPTIELPDPILDSRLGLGMGPGDALVEQLVVQAAVVGANDVARPALMFTGRSAHGGVLPKWMYPGRDEDIERLVTLVRDMADVACRGAARERGVTGG